MNVVKLLGEATVLTTTGNNIDSGTKILLQHNHNGGNAHLVTLKNIGGTTLGSVYVAPHRPIMIDKESTDTLETESGVSDVYGTSVAHMG
ncbi:hypothetical protein AAJ61_gp105 [Synechococcus phage ACG-2014j]|uniref:Uncharacterized protein n=2 Tax=Potamoivirus TaxID=2948872 RepID=A0A1D8KMJ7_9CAUD|nr:hypothetical protein AAJ61_gp105 [Synechococcus phage ACG-2014j]YP_009320545.1 hypothetical protein BOQ05_gp152 [Synechococcus phage S-CAM4]AIX24000.1 hypothetical protein Syn7803US103_105 [Synechococcus phage ACG-2014j]AOV59573.1 hypothetical protein S330809_112 [Synechococcus phage S-CAM4]AOV59811.1 hypothetical protein N231010_112 [Synechococcus phage S-CAM4]